MAAQCRACGNKLFGDEVLKGVCEYCEPGTGIQQAAAVAAAGPVREVPAPGRSPDEDPRPWRRRADDFPLRRGGPDWTAFRTGVTVLCVLCGVRLLFDTFTALPLFVMQVEDWGGWWEKIVPFERTVQVLSLLVALFALALLCAVPPETGLRRRAYAMIGSLVLGVAAVLVFFGILLLGMVSPDARLSPAAVDFAALTCIAVVLVLGVFSLVCLVSLLAGAARSLGEPGLAGGIVIFFVVLIASVGGRYYLFRSMTQSVADFAAAGNRGKALATVYGILVLALAYAWVFSLWFLSLMLRLRRATLAARAGA